MSLISNLVSSFLGNTHTEDPVKERPTALCPSDCAIPAEGCEACAALKKELIDQLYYVEHLQEFLDRYEIAEEVQGGTYTCPFCGAPSSSPYVCDYCDMKIGEDNGKIRVKRASDIPNPIMDAQDIIFRRYDEIVEKYCSEEDQEVRGFLQSIMSQLLTEDKSDSDLLGARMSEEEIREMAASYGVSVSDYLKGVDSGKYLTKSVKAAQTSYTAAPAYSQASLSFPALALLGGTFLWNTGHQSSLHQQSHQIQQLHTGQQIHPTQQHHMGGHGPGHGGGNMHPGGHGQRPGRK